MSGTFCNYSALVLFFLGSLASAAEGDGCGKFQKRWERCKRNRDCVLTQNACGMAAAVNKKYRDAFDDFESCSSAYTACPAVEPDPPGTPTRKLKAICQVGQCVVE